ncbi:FAD-dependent thymidylate synthase [Actinoplanes sp. NPDC024001]|uniref:FAD-dependent thymidylate synthase n=1 Tax=Actinoplanes sp. NPDC024001 TaxID=3154598 RepID=UPI0033F3ABCA
MNFSPIPRIAPPPLGSETTGGSNCRAGVSSIVASRAPERTLRPAGPRPQAAASRFRVGSATAPRRSVRSSLRPARVSTLGEQSLEELQKDHERSRGLINYLMRDRHGTPFEHNSLTFFVSAPIFVFREFQRHRVGFSYNEESGRYRELQPVFYVPGPDVSSGITGRSIADAGAPLRAPRCGARSSPCPTCAASAQRPRPGPRCPRQ